MPLYQHCFSANIKYSEYNFSNPFRSQSLYIIEYLVYCAFELETDNSIIGFISSKQHDCAKKFSICW